MNIAEMSHSLTVGERGFAAFRSGLATGNWNDFLAMLTEDFTFFFPTGKYQGTHIGKEIAEEFFAYVHSIFPQGLFITETIAVSVSENSVLFEFRDEGVLNNTPYKNRVAVSFSIRDQLICGYREYFGSDGKSNWSQFHRLFCKILLSPIDNWSNTKEEI